ncbi:ATP synthase F1 subunit gamma [Chondromyces apiculatus]|uniref:ATP synthase gamma chain n=1 Tax=Chondromyces apiculatus DSM 436 TaxID=1192034 RepID=A0A017TAH5_9BACT|nr:ATP synthase F1 subunit gamma [Chondromyces apiculatus]EYF05591.1 ATP synthase gamma chain [Chondromyces apiculatus DSM 436]
MPSLKAIRNRITSVKSTQKITRAMKMVAGARLNRAQTRITELRPYAVKVQEVLSQITREVERAGAEVEAARPGEGSIEKPAHPLLVRRPEQRVLMVVLTSDRGLCGAFNTNINKRAEREWRERKDQGQDVQLMLIGRKGRDYFTRRGAPILEYLPGVWDKLNLESAKRVGTQVLQPFLRGDVDAIYLVYNEFKSAMTQNVTVERLLPAGAPAAPLGASEGTAQAEVAAEFLFEPNKEALLEQLAPMYVEVSVLRALYESTASELGARMTAMDSATKNATEMIDGLTLKFNKARQAAITKELMEIIGGSEALKD